MNKGKLNEENRERNEGRKKIVRKNIMKRSKEIISWGKTERWRKKSEGKWLIIIISIHIFHIPLI